MKRVIRRLATIVAVGFAVGLSGVSGARASDIDCKSPAGGSSVRCEDPRGVGMRCTLATDDPRPRARHHLICDSTRLSERYERIYAEQQRMLRKGRIQNSDITAWRARRDACDSVRCLEGMFARFWRERDSMRNAPARPASPPQAATAMSGPATHEPAPSTAPTQSAQEQPASTESLAMHSPEPTEFTRSTEAPISSPATHEPAPATTPTQSAQEQPTSTASLAMQVGPELTEFTLLTATPVETPAARQAAARPIADGMHSSPGKSRPAALAVESLFSGLAVLGMGVGFLWTRHNARAQDRPRSTVRAVMVIAYVLLFVNALLLPFTLGLK